MDYTKNKSNLCWYCHKQLVQFLRNAGGTNLCISHTVPSALLQFQANDKYRTLSGISLLVSLV